MRILYLTQTYLPEPLRIISELAESLKAAGHDVVVLTGFPNYPEGKLYPDYKIKICHKETINGIPVIRLPVYINHGDSGIKRLLNYFSFAASIAVLAPWFVPPVDVIHAIDPPYIGPSTWILSRILRVPFTMEIQDLYPETLHGTKMLNNKLILKAVDWLAKWMYRSSTMIRVISAGFRDNLLMKGISANKIHTIPNWVDTDFYRPLERDVELAKRFGLADRFNIIYAGNMGKAQSLDVVLEAAALLNDLSDIQFVLAGYGTDVAQLQEIVQRRNLKNVLFISRRQEEEMPALLALAEVLLVQLRDEPVFRITIPHKTYSYMASGKPILAAVAGETAKLIESSKTGIACHPADPQAIADAVRRFHAMSPEERKKMGENGRRTVCESFDRAKIVGEIISMLNAVIHKHR